MYHYIGKDDINARDAFIVKNPRKDGESDDSYLSRLYEINEICNEIDYIPDFAAKEPGLYTEYCNQYFTDRQRDDGFLSWEDEYNKDYYFVRIEWIEPEPEEEEED